MNELRVFSPPFTYISKNCCHGLETYEHGLSYGCLDHRELGDLSHITSSRVSDILFVLFSFLILLQISKSK